MRVVGIHGINQHRSTRDELVTAWSSALETGLAKAGLPRMVVDLRIAYYADLYVAHRAEWKVPDDPAVELDQLAGKLVLEWNVALGVDAEVPSETKGLSVPATPLAVQVAVHRLAASPGLQGFGVAGVRRLARHMHAYLCYDDTRELTLARVSEAVGDGADVLLGHSMGSVVAYEWLHRNLGGRPPLLVTIGSPLGCAPVLSRLRPALAVPGSGQWVNVAATHDPIAWPKRLAGVFGPGVEDRAIGFRFWAHAAQTYLRSVPTAVAVAAGSST